MQYFADENPPILVAIVHDTSDRQQLGKTLAAGDEPHANAALSQR